MAIGLGDTAGIKNKFLLQLLQDEAPIQSHTQGANHMAKALLSGMMMKDENTASKEMAAILMGGPTGTTPAAPTGGIPAPTPAQATPANTTNKIYSQDELNPLDPPQGADRDLMIRVMHAEAARETPEGQRAVAEVIRNRAVNGGYGGDTIPGVINKPNAFEPVNNPQGRARMAALDPNSPEYARYGQAVDSAYRPENDQTGGATHFYAPKAQAALAPVDGRPTVPTWAQGQQPTAAIGGHTFYRPDQPQPGPQAAPQPAPQQMAQAQPQAPVAPPQGPQNDTVARLQQAAANHPNKSVREQAQKMLLQLKVQELGKDKFVPVYDAQGRVVGQQSSQTGEKKADPTVVDSKYEKVGEDQYGKPIFGWVNPRDRSITKVDDQGGQPASAAPAVPPPPPGVDPKVWREMQTKNLATEALPPKFDDVAQVRKEVQNLPSYKNHAQAAPIYKTLVDSAGRDTRASDLNLVYGLGKIFDPGSVVREGEMVMVKNTAGLPDWLVGSINALNGGAALTPATRKAIMQEAYSRMKSYEDVYDYDTEHYKGIAGRARMNVDDVIPPLRRSQPWQPPEPPPAASGAAPAPSPAAPSAAPKASAPQSSDGWKDMGNGVRIREKR
jgi:spore germination cell wall hydrolase CwlJ-like protein